MLKNFWMTIVGFFKGPKWKKAQEVAKQVGDLLPYVETVVSLVAATTGNKTAAEIDNVIRKVLAVPPEALTFDPSKPYTKLDLNGALMGAVNYAVRGELNKAIQMAGTGGLLIGGQKIKDASDIPDNIINTALNSTYTFVRNSF